MRAGLEIDYAIVLHGFPIPWKTVIDVWEPGVRFVDRQVNGPYVWWHHEHRFEAAAGGGTRVIDHVEFVPRLRLFTNRFVRRDVERIFAYRKEALKRIFGEKPRVEPPEPRHLTAPPPRHTFRQQSPSSSQTHPPHRRAACLHAFVFSR